MTTNEVQDWFAAYVEQFAALCRGEVDTAAVEAYLRVPLLVTTDDLARSLGTDDEITSWLQAQADAMTAADYDHTAVLSDVVDVVNRRTATVRAHLARQRRDGSLINEMTVTYVLVRHDDGEFAVAGLHVHSV